MSDDELRQVEARGTFGNTPAAARLECLLAATGDKDLSHRVHVLLNRALTELKGAGEQIRDHPLLHRVIVLLGKYHVTKIDGAAIPEEFKTYMRCIVVTRARRAIRESDPTDRGS
jgi:hypothetical protein